MTLTLADYTNIGIGLAVLYMAFQTKRDQIKAQNARERSEAAIKEATDKAALAVESQKLDASRIAHEVKSDLLKSTAVNDKKLNTIHELVNSDMGKKLKELSDARGKIYELTGKASDKAMAEEAHRLLVSHQSKQDGVDVKKETGFEGQPKNGKS